MKKLYLSNKDRKIGGVCGGLGEYFGKDSTLFRVLFILLAVFSLGIGVIGYLGMWLVIPKRPKEEEVNN
ncbi:MAG: PspC domain-containing protein [Candidatus Omnitrophica bacterium 4484_70.1]|nr:MAG: PspC domain-containing protein [Candidatus Omnitrophica bacterium 4484_70.1]